MSTADPYRQALELLAGIERECVAELKSERSRRRGEINRRLHEARRRINPDAYPYFSQAGQDAVVDRLLGQKRQGTFVDIGGYDGSTGSNTLFFEQRRGWQGVLVEPVPSQLAKAQAIRCCPCLGYAIASADGGAEFIEVINGYTQMSGLVSSYDPGLLDQVRARPEHKEATIRVETRRLQGIIEEAGIENPDFVSLDIEGGEVEALTDFPFERHRVGIWSIENNTGTPEIPRIMRAAGYELVEFCGPDEIWRKGDL